MQDFAYQMRWLVDVSYPHATVIRGGPGQLEHPPHGFPSTRPFPPPKPGAS